jgi:hypothetical protein
MRDKAELSEAIERALSEHYAGPGHPRIKRIAGELISPEPDDLDEG